MFPILYNGVQYSAASVNHLAFGVPVTGMIALNWKRVQVKENVYSLPNDPAGRTYGQIAYECSMTVFRDWWKAVCDAAPNKNPLDIAPFNWTLAFGVDLKTPVFTETLMNFEFLEDGSTVNAGDTKLTQEIKCIFAGVVRA